MDEVNVLLIPADFDAYNLEDLKKESSNGVCWKNSDKNGRTQEIRKDDIVYIYFHDSRNLTNRILLKAKVSESDYKIDGKFLYSEYIKRELRNPLLTDTEKEELMEYAEGYKGFYLTDFKAINEKYSKSDKFRYISKSENKGTEGVGGVKINRTKIYLYRTGNVDVEESKKNLYEDLKNTRFERKIDSLISDYNNNACMICGNKNTFLKENNLYYYEIHHVLQQSFNNVLSKCNNEDLKNKYPWYKNEYQIKRNDTKRNADKLIYTPFNEVRLCSYCHNQLHYGKREDRKRILNKLVNENYKDELKSIVGSKDLEKVLDYIYSQYELKYKN